MLGVIDVITSVLILKYLAVCDLFVLLLVCVDFTHLLYFCYHLCCFYSPYRVCVRGGGGGAECVCVRERASE